MQSHHSFTKRLRESVWISLVIVALVALGSACKDQTEIRGTGTVRFINVEGGFYGIVGDDGAKYDPVNLDESFKVEGQRVRYRLKVASDRVSFHMWGTIVEVLHITKL